jgi:hypothetical protein
LKAILVLFALLVATHATPPKFPNVGWVGHGYNIFYGNPHATNDLDPGFGADPVFALTYNDGSTTADGLWTVPDHVSIPGTTDACSLSSEGVTCQTTEAYSSELQVDCSADFSGFGAAFSASVDYQNVQQETSSQSSVFVSTKGVCTVYRAYINIDVHPALTDTFTNVAAALPSVYNISTGPKFWSFFDLYGTHYMTQISFGARWGYLFESTQSQWTTLESTGLNIGAAASYDGLFIHAGVSTNDSTQTSEAATFDQYTSSFYQFSLGNPPPSDGDLDTWENQTIHSTALSPLGYALDTIDQLFTPAFTTDPALHARQPILYAALLDYCANYLAPNNFTSVPC